MGSCQDCSMKEATVIIYDKKEDFSFLVCDDCISKDDILIKQTINDIANISIQQAIGEVTLCANVRARVELSALANLLSNILQFSW